MITKTEKAFVWLVYASVFVEPVTLRSDSHLEARSFNAAEFRVMESHADGPNFIEGPISIRLLIEKYATHFDNVFGPECSVEDAIAQIEY